jgi:methylated-DNA-[protein]-cysteine S-methyltransferase
VPTTHPLPTSLPILLPIDSPLGPLRLLADPAGEALIGLYLPRQAAPEAIAAPAAAAPPVLARAAAQLAEYFAGARRDFDVPLAPRGTEFQRRVWRELEAIPFGQTRTYGELARAVGHPTASRAVGAANGRNPLSIFVPCHRVIAGSGALTGYAGGLDAKRWLLAHEARLSPGELFASAGGSGRSGVPGPRSYIMR